MTDTAFHVYGFAVSAAQRDAGLGVMTGTFSYRDVLRALARAGVTDSPGRFNTSERAADRLLQSERRAGRIRVAKGQGRGMWERVA